MVYGLFKHSANENQISKSKYLPIINVLLYLLSEFICNTKYHEFEFSIK